MTQYIKRLPAVFQTVTEKKFFDATFDQVLSKKDSDLLSGFIGRRDPGSYNPITDFYLPEPSKDRTWWQLEATAYAREADSTKSNLFFYDDLLNSIEYYGGNTLNQDRLFESEYYSFGPPIDYDMFINYQNYYWVEQGLPTIEISGVQGADIIGQSSYTTPATATPANFTLSTGMTISLLDDPLYTEPHVVENFGDCNGIGLIPRFTDVTAGTIFEFLPWDGSSELSTGRIIQNENWDTNPWEVQSQPGNGDYITIERGARDRNAWSRSNKWIHIDTINRSITETESVFPSNATRAMRPIIQFVADIPLYNSGTQYRNTISYGFRDGVNGIPLTLSDFQGQALVDINNTYGTEMADQDLVCWFNDPSSIFINFFPWDTELFDSIDWDAGNAYLTNNYIFVANVQLDGTVIFTPYTSFDTPILDGDIVIVSQDSPGNGAQQGTTWYFESGIWQQVFNEKVSTNQPPLFQLFDHNGVRLDDSATYPLSTFRGSKIFSYKVNSTPGATVDPVLKFPIVYTSLGQSSDIVFQNDLITNRYTYTAALTPISGYYYYNVLPSNVLFNSWNLYNPCACPIPADPNYQRLVATAGQTVFNTSIPTVGNSSNKTYLQVYINGVYQTEGALSSYQVTGGNQITFNSGLAALDEVVIYSYSVIDNIPDYEGFFAAPAQTIFNTVITTAAASSGNSYLQVYVNGVYQEETVSYSVTGVNQITFLTGLLGGDNVSIIGSADVAVPFGYSSFVSTAAQTTFTTLFPIFSNSVNVSYSSIYVNGIYQIEGVTGAYQITDPNQVTFNSGLQEDDNVVIFATGIIAEAACPTSSKQRVIDKFVVGYGSEYSFRLSVTPYGYLEGAGPVQPAADILVNVNGVEIRNEVGGFEFFELNNRIYINLSVYLSNLLINTQSVPPVVEAQTYTHGLLNPEYPGYFQIPQQLEANPSQLEVGEISGSDLTQQFSSIIENQIGFTGSAFGGVNNYRDSGKNRSLGEYILQNVSPALKSMLVSSEDDLSFIAGVRFSSDEYTKFKNKFLSVALQLINQGFNPVQFQNNTINISAWVSEILKVLNISKEFSNAFAYSFMAAQGTPFASETFAVDGNSLISLADYVDLSDPRNIIYVYEFNIPTNERILTSGIDYEIVSTNLSVDIQLKLGAGVKDIYVALYRNPIPTYIPSTPTKVGTYGAYIPRIELDTTYAIPTEVIIGHDGSKTVAYGDYRDNLLLDLETRIYNFLQPKYRNEYYIPVRLEGVKSGYFRQTRYSIEEYNTITESYLNKWSAKNRANYRVNDWPTASLDTPVDQLWKLYNYRPAVTPDGAATNLPGNWKGIFQYYYDTYYPDTRPWEMLGFSEQPSWWQFEYGAPVLNLAGQEVWTSVSAGNNSLWEDLEAGIIRQGPSSIFDPDTLVPQPQEMWARPGLSAVIPVDAAGEIIPVIDIFGLAYTGNPYEPFDQFDSPWVYGDGSPVEQAWMSTSGYRYSIQEFLFLMKPGPFGERMWDTLGTDMSPGLITIPTAGPNATNVAMSNKNWQYVQNDTFSYDDEFFAWFRPKNKDQIVHAEIVNGVTEVRFGYQTWISDRILFLGKDVGDTFGQKIRTLDVNLANKVAGFINKDTTNTYISSVTPGTTTNTLIIPSTNFDVFLHKSPVIDTYSYSGIIVRALEDGTFVVYGYDLLNAEFITLDRTTDKLIDVSVGGTPAEFRYFESGATYAQGEIVRYNGVYYTSNVTQTVQKFISSGWDKLRALPTEGGISVTYKPVSAETTTRYPYGSILRTPQEVFDLMIGWGAYLESQGWQFTNVNPDTNIVDNWLSSAKQFLFWLNTNWEPDASIQLSPLANTASLIVKRGYPNDVETLSNGVYSILDKFGVAISPQNTTTDREGPLITVAPANLSAGGIYFLQVNASETEHVLIFDNETNFSDIIYSPLLRARQQRLRFYGFRSNGWYGKMEAPGYLIIDNQLVPNYDTIVTAMRYYYDANVTIDNSSLEDLGRHLIGYESKSYLDNLEVENDVQYLFYQGAIRQKGTQQAIEKLFRSTKVQSDEIIKIYEEWALKLGDFGNTVEQVSTEFKLKPEQNTGEVIVARLNFVPSSIGFVKSINILNAENTYNNIPELVIPLPDATPDVAWTNFSTDETYQVGSVVNYPDRFGNPVYYSSNTAQSPTSFIPANWTVVLATRVCRAYVVLDSTNRISRIDITDPGYGYLSAPAVTIDSGFEPHNLDRLYSVWQGEIISDETLDNIINIDIDETDVWVVRPTDPSVALEFPVTDRIDYALPNSGYVNFNDVTLYSFDAEQLSTQWGTLSFNPLENNTIWIANTFAQDWGVYKLIDVTAPSDFAVVTSAAGNLMLRTAATYKITPQFTNGIHETDFGNLVALQVIEAHAEVSAVDSLTNAITEITITKTGSNYFSVPTIVDVEGPGSGASLTATIAGGVVSGITINSGGTGYSVGDKISISPPADVGADTNYVVAFEFNQSETDNNPVYNYYDLVTLAGNPITSEEIPVFTDFTKLMLFKTMRWYTTPAEPLLPVYVKVNDLIWVDDVDGKWAVFKIQAEPGIWDINSWDPEIIDYWISDYGWDITGPMYFSPYRIQQPLINTSLFESASVFNESGTELVQLPIYDPFKYILPGLAKQNLTYVSLQDPARYNVTGNERLFSENITFAEHQVGQLWWDTSSSRIVYYEQPIALDGSETEVENLVYRRDRWAQMFPGSTIAIYEWVKSKVPPSQYTGTGTPRDVTTYVQITTSNRFTSITETNYYFWVIGATDKPNIENRTLAAVEVANLLGNPKSQGFAFFAPVQQTPTNNSYMFYNVQEILAYQGDNIQIQYRISERDDQEHTQWAFFREGDSGSLITDQFWDKMVDSLCKYTKVLPISEEYANSIVIASDLPWDIFGWDVASWDSSTELTSPQYGEILPVPDPALSEAEKYGVTYRPRQGMFVDLFSARKIFVQAANELLKYIPIRDDNPSWNTGVSTDVYWTYTNWYAVGYEDVLPTVVYQTLAEANTALLAGEIQLGTIIQVVDGTVDGRYVLYATVQINPNVPVLSFNEVCIENSAIKLLDTVYTSRNKYGLAQELRELLNAFRTEVFVDEYIVDQNELFFSMLNYVLSEQKNPDWVFKSSYIYIKEDNVPLTQSQLYSPDQIDNVIEYIRDAKPYHTQIRDYSTAYSTADIAPGTAEDFIKWALRLQFGPNGAESVDPYENRPLLNSVADVNQFISSQTDFDPTLADIQVPILGLEDNSKRGLSELFPYTFDFDSINIDNPQTFITPYNIVAIKSDDNTLIYGQDYYVEYNEDSEDYTVYFFNDQSAATELVAFVWFDGGAIQNSVINGYRNELAAGTVLPDMVMNVDTKLPVNISTGVPTPYVGYGDVWDAVVDPIAQILIDAGGQAEIPWDSSTVLELFPNTISFKENVNPRDGANFYRNAFVFAGTLMNNIPAPDAVNYNLGTITVFVDPVSHPDGTDILPNPTIQNPGAVWIEGERIEYLVKTPDASPNTWILSLIRRGTMGTSATEHLTEVPEVDEINTGLNGETILKTPTVLAPNRVWVEEFNSIPGIPDPNLDIWNALSSLPDPTSQLGFDREMWDEFMWDSSELYGNITSVPLGGLWYANTTEAVFLKDKEGKSIP